MVWIYFQALLQTLACEVEEGGKCGRAHAGARWRARQHGVARVCVQRLATPPRLHKRLRVAFVFFFGGSTCPAHVWGNKGAPAKSFAASRIFRCRVLRLFVCVAPPLEV